MVLRIYTINYSPDSMRIVQLVVLLFCSVCCPAQHWQWVDPRIGSVGVGRTFPGPSMPFGMVKPGPDCGVLPNAGWAPMPEAVAGFSQTHVSGTGGGQKYGNILIQPFTGKQAAETAGTVVAIPQPRSLRCTQRCRPVRFRDRNGRRVPRGL